MYEVILAASTLLYAGLVAVYITRPFASFFHPATLYLALHGFLFVLRPIVARLYEFDLIYRLYRFEPSLGDKIAVIVGANVGLLAFVLASWRLANRSPTPYDGGASDSLRTRMVKPLLLIGAGLGPLALYSALLSWDRRANAFDTMARSADTGVQVNLEGTGWFYDAALMLVPLTVLIVWVTRFRWYGWLPFGAFLVLQAGSGVRGPMVYALVAVMALWLMDRRRAWPDWRTVAAVGVMVVAFNVIVLDRGNAVREAFGGPSGNDYATGAGLDPLEHMDFANLEYFEYLVYAVPQRSGSYDYFAQNLQIFTEPVPRALWKDKPHGSPVQFFNLWDYGRPIGITTSMPGQGWLALGYPGIVIQCGLFGLLFGAMYRMFLVRRHGAGARLIYAFVLANLVLCVRDGTLLVLVRTLPFYLGPVLLVLAGAKAFMPQVRDPGFAMPDMASPRERRAALAALIDQNP